MSSRPRSYSTAVRWRYCPTCKLGWPSLTFYYRGLSTRCPYCGQPVDGGGLVGRREAEEA